MGNSDTRLFFLPVDTLCQKETQTHVMCCAAAARFNRSKATAANDTQKCHPCIIRDSAVELRLALAFYYSLSEELFPIEQKKWSMDNRHIQTFFY